MEQARKQIASSEIAMANEVFDLFCNATTLKSILGHFRHLCDLLKMRPNVFPQFYPKFKSKLRSWKAQALWKKFDQRASHKCYNRGKACPNSRVLIIGGGPCGLRSAIEAQLLGAKVVVVEKRDRVSRNNVLHLWPFVIQDLRALGAKKFFGKFCAGSIDHISIRQLQCILLKVSLILGVEFHENVSFESLIPPPENQEEGKIGWRAKTTPSDHPVSQYEFDVLVGADGKRNTLEGFKRKEFRGKLAIAITANFINKRTEAEARVEEISGVAFIFNQKFFKELYRETGIDLENIVYYKDDTHYFVMTAKKHSLIDKGVILRDHADTAKLLAKENVDRDALMLYAREAAEFSTEYQMMDMEFAVNHYGQPDVAMFDFTSMYAAENASRVLERHGHRLLMTLVGDSLLEPFWPTGSGCARGFLSSMDAGWAIKGWGASVLPLQVLAERESIYRLLGQTTPENLNRDYAAYTLDPHTRYPNLNSRSVSAVQVLGLLDTDDPETAKQLSAVPSAIDVPKKRRRRDTQVHPDTLLHWLQRQVALYDNVHVLDMGASFKDGLAISAIIHRYRPDLIDFNSLATEDAEKNNQLAFDILEKELGIPPVMTGEEMATSEVPDKLAMFSYLTRIYEAFRGEIPHIKHPKLEPENDERPLYTKQLSQLSHEQKAQLIGRLAKPDSALRTRHSRSRQNNENVLAPLDKKTETAGRRSRKRRSTEKMGATVEERQKRLEEIDKNRVDRTRKRQYLRKMATQQFIKSIQMLAANAKREKDEPFEDYSIFLYRQTAPDFKDRVKELEQKILYPDREPKLHAGNHRGSVDDDFSGRIKDFEDKLKGTAATEKKPRDLLRAIGKIEKTDWNVKEIEKKIEENKMGRGTRKDRVEKVPKWSREQFLARQIKMEKKGRDPGESDGKYADIDSTLKDIDRKIREGNVLGHNKVSAMAEQFATKSQDHEPAKVQRSNSKAAITLPTQGGSELCHFCDKRVYLMERMSTEGKFFHRGCFRCEYCSTSLRIGNHAFDRDKDGGRFYCTQHFGLTGTTKARAEKKKLPLLNKENVPESSSTKKQALDKAKTPLDGVAGLDLLDRGQTPERIEFENLAGMSDPEEAQSQMDEDEWTDRNFGASAAEMGSSDDVSDTSDSDEENEVYEEAMDQPLTTEGTIELAKNWTLRYSHPHVSTGHSDTGSNEYEDSSDEYTSEDEESGTATEDEEDVRARELRKREVWLKVPPRSSDTDTGSETEVASDNDSSEDSQENSATEISTDSEFEHDGTTPTQHEIPEITINDARARKNRGQVAEPKKVRIKSRVISSINGNLKQNEDPGMEQLSLKPRANERRLEKSPLDKFNEISSKSNRVETTLSPSPLVNPRKGDYLLNRTHSTEGIASRLSLELKKQYLLGGSMLGGTVVKSGSTSNVDTRLRNLSDAISQHQKLLNPAPEPSPTMRAFLQGTEKFRSGNPQTSPISPTRILSAASPKAFPVRAIPLAAKASSDDPAQSAISEVPLPDLVKETSILESGTRRNVSRGETPRETSSVGREEVEKKPEERPSPKNVVNVENVSGEENDVCRPRSPLHETSIVVPRVDWSKNARVEEAVSRETSSQDSEMDGDSLSSSSGEDSAAKANGESPLNISPPRLRIHSIDGQILLDVRTDRQESAMNFEPDSIEFIDLGDEKIDRLGTNSTPSTDTAVAEESVEAVNDNLKKLRLDEITNARSNCSSPGSSASAKRDYSMENDATTAALTETEFSEWARDGEAMVADDLRDVELHINPEFITLRKNRGNRDKKFSPPCVPAPARIAKEEDLTDIELDSIAFDRVIGPPSNDTSKLLANGENIDYMDTDDESLLDDSLREATNVSLLKNRGYVEFVNVGSSSAPPRTETRPVVDAPIARAETENEFFSDNDHENVIEINPITMEDVRDRLKCSAERKSSSPQEDPRSSRTTDTPTNLRKSEPEEETNGNPSRRLSRSMEEDSLIVIEPAEDTTTSEITTVLASPVNPQTTPMTAGPQSVLTIEDVVENARSPNDPENPDYLEYVKRLRSRIAEFSNAKDSIDVRKSKRKNSKSSLQQKSSTEMIAEETKARQESPVNGELPFNSPATSRKLEELTRERTKQKTLIQDLLMDKMEAHKQKSAEKKARRAARTCSFGSAPSNVSPVPGLPTPLTFVPTSIGTPINTPGRTTFREARDTTSETPLSSFSRGCATSSETSFIFQSRSGDGSDRPSTSLRTLKPESSTDRRENSHDEVFTTPVAPPRLKHEEARKIAAERAKREARERARLKSDEDLGLSPEDRIKELRMKIARRRPSVEEESERVRETRKDLGRPGFGLDPKIDKLQTSRSSDNVKALFGRTTFETLPTGNAKSMDQLPRAGLSEKSDNDPALVVKREKKKSPKDPERRKSIIKAVSDFFKKKDTPSSPSSPKDRVSVFRLSSKSKDKGKFEKLTSPAKNETRPRSVCEEMLVGKFTIENLPPVPPPPLDYKLEAPRLSDDSLSDEDSKTAALSSSRISRTPLGDASCDSIPRRSKTTKRVTRQAQLKRLRMAQEIQRKLEETEVKQRELECRGVSVEKALRGEGETSDREEADLLREWFDLMRERTELRRYERELLVRAQEVQLEDRHERLEHELRERLADDDQTKTGADVKKEGEILTEMLEIVAKRDSLKALLEEERQRYRNEDRDLEARMLAKGLRLTPINEPSPKYSV